MAKRLKRRGGPSKQRLWIFAAGTVLVVILAVIAALVLFRKEVVHEAIARQLSQYGLSDATFSVDAVEQSHVVLRSVRLADGLGIESLRADFSLGGLMDGQLKSVTVSGLNAEITEEKNGPLALVAALAQNRPGRPGKDQVSAIPEVRIENARIRAGTKLGEGVITASGRISPRRAVSLDLQGEGTLKAVANHPLKVDGLEARLTTPDGGLPATLSIERGTASDQARSPLFNAMALNGRVRATQDRIYFTVSGNDRQSAVGFSARGRYGLARGTILLDDVQVQAFSGSMSTKDVRFTPGKPVVVPVTFKRVDMAQLMKLTGLEGLSGTGRLSGTVPVELRPDQVIVHEGTLAAVEDGVLMFKSETAQKALRSGGRDVTMLLSALEDFRYTKLSLTVKKDEAGQAVVRLSTEGRNPAVQEGRKFIINVNLSVNLDDILTALWESYRLSGAVIRSTVKGAK